MSGHQQNGRDATHETQIGKLLETRLLQRGEMLIKRVPLVPAVRLEQELGLGDRPAIRRALYRKLEALQREWGAPVQKIVWNTLKRSSSAQQPGRFFAVVVVDELDRLGFLTRLR